MLMKYTWIIEHPERVAEYLDPIVKYSVDVDAAFRSPIGKGLGLSLKEPG
jgi:hypothetical protein